jgi:hypothetical protein
MSIEDEIEDRVRRQMLFPLIPRAAGATIRRAMFVEEWLWKELNSTQGDPEWDERIAKLQADLEVFVTEEFITPKYLRLLYPKEDAVWEIRSIQEQPSIRVMGLFPIKDAFVSTNFALREALVEKRGDKMVDWQSRAWKQVKRMARAVWRKLFGTYLPVETISAKDVCSGATNEIFYKERT